MLCCICIIKRSVAFLCWVVVSVFACACVFIACACISSIEKMAIENIEVGESPSLIKPNNDRILRLNRFFFVPNVPVS